VATPAEGRSGYAPIRHEVTDAELLAHLTGEKILGTYPLLPDGTVKAIILDVDGPNTEERGRAAAFQVTNRLAQSLCQRGNAPIWVDSGGKGYHLWRCFKSPVEAKGLREGMTHWLDSFRPFPEGVMVELFPKQDQLHSDGLGSLIRLPLGRHPETGRMSSFLTQDGQSVVADPCRFLAEAAWSDGAALLASPLCEPMPIPSPPAEIMPVVQGCTLLWHLVRRAAEVKHLRHTERLALLYTLGHLGEAGKTYLHQVIGLCSNYDSRITERWIQRVEEGHRAIRCETLKEWLKDYLPGVTCPCLPKRKNPSPLDWLRPASRSRVIRSAPEEGADGWDEVAQELFGDAMQTKEKLHLDEK
jgi:hypothetical protein